MRRIGGSLKFMKGGTRSTSEYRGEERNGNVVEWSGRRSSLMPLSDWLRIHPSSPIHSSPLNSLMQAPTVRRISIIAFFNCAHSTLTPSNLLPDHPTPPPSLFFSQAKHVQPDLLTYRCEMVQHCYADSSVEGIRAQGQLHRVTAKGFKIEVMRDLKEIRGV